MKPYLCHAALLGCFLCGRAQSGEVQTPPVTIEAKIPEPAREPTVSQPAPPIEKPDFEIETTQVKLIEVVEAPPMTGLPPVKGTMTLTVHGVADPGLPEVQPVEQAPVTPPSDTPTVETPTDLPETRFVSISATVYGHCRTLLKCQPMDNTSPPVTVWSNIDFNHFRSVANFDAKGADGKLRQYYLMMGIGNEEGNQLADGSAIPTLPDGAPAYLILTDNPAAESLRLVEDLHALYRTDGAKMEADAVAREKAEEVRRAYLLAHPPKPKDVTVHFWKREAAESQDSEGGQP